MFVLVSADELRSAPGDVQQWFSTMLPGMVLDKLHEAAKQPEPTPEPTSEKPKEVSLGEVKEAAGKLLQKNPELLKGILAKMGIKRVTECPKERLAEMLAEIAIHVGP